VGFEPPPPPVNPHGTRTLLRHPADRYQVGLPGLTVVERFLCPLFAARHVHYEGYGLELFTQAQACEACGREWYREGEDTVNGRCSDCRPDLTVREPAPAVWYRVWAELQAPCVCGSTNHANWNCPWYQDRVWGARP